MKKYIVPFLILISSNVWSQKAKVHSYYDRFWKRVENVGDAHYYRVVEKENGRYHVKDYYMSGALQSEIFCTAITPTLQFDSELTLYHENGKPSQIGHFKNEKPYGFHQFFFENGNKRKNINYRDDKSYFCQFWNNEGIPLLTNGAGSIEEPNELYGTIYTIVKDSLALAMYYKIDADTIFTVVDKRPEYPGGHDAMKKDLKSNLTYPVSARRTKVEGTVYVRFIIDKTGEVRDALILRGVGPDVDAAALQGVSMLNKWTPGSQNNKAVNFSYVIPIRFDLKGWWFW